MAESFDVKILTLPLGAYNGATHLPLAYLPAAGGAITILSAELMGAAGTAVGGLLVSLTDAGTPAIAGTIGALAGTVVQAAGVPAAFTLSSAVVDDGQYIGYDQTSGTVPAGSFISIAYVTGR
jgi:hypothetical protein